MAITVIPSPKEIEDALQAFAEMKEHIRLLSAKALVAYKHHADQRGMEAVTKLAGDINHEADQIREFLLFCLSVAERHNRKGDHNIKLLETVDARITDLEEIKAEILKKIKDRE